MATYRTDDDATWRDLAIVIAAGIVFAVLSAHFELGEMIAAMTLSRERYQLDELPGIFLFMALGLVWFAWRRLRETRAALQRQIAIEAKLGAALAENRRLERANIRIQEDERKNLAREMHDEFGQYLNAIKVDAVGLRDATAQDPVEVKRCSARIIGIVDHLQNAARDIVRRLRPAGLDELGLAAAIEDCLEGWRRRLPAVTFECKLAAELETFDEDVNITLYRLVQEGLTNVARHAHASRVTIDLDQHHAGDNGSGVVELRIRDNGVGAAASAGSGVGLVGMRERVESLAGTFAASNVAGGGFRITARLPLRDARVDA
jgi:two-component system, NarL family, sensor histidine kinase UhpB